MRIKELIKKLNKYNLNKDVVIYSNKKTLKNYEFLGTYENEGQVEIHIDEGINLG
jgi:propanediol utilization protein|tara:strand:+ start:331 stop:495 length:165 start_codon:yes stop_codon:yes gene_type:complete